MIEIRDLSKNYHRAGRMVAALRKITLSIKQGDIYGIIGPSGAGKSTFIRCLAGLIRPTSGEVLFQGGSISQMEKAELRGIQKKIGMIFQHFHLFSSRTAAANVAYPLEIAGIPKEEREKRVDELLRLVGLFSKKEVFPSHLSGGEKQRVGIARALANHPPVLLCDEATSSLDPRTTRDILDLLKRVHEQLGVTIVLITHDMEVIKRICHKVAVIADGAIVEAGLTIDVFADPQHAITQKLIQSTSHDIPQEFFKKPSPNRKLLRLRFKGHVSSEPIISHIVKQYHVDANILLGWMDRLQTLVIGTLILEITGSPEGIQSALHYLEQKQVHYEVLEHAI